MTASSKARWLAPLAILAAIGGVVVHWIGAPVEASRFRDPTGAYEVVVSYRRFEGWSPVMPGGGSDKPGAVSIYDARGVLLGRAPIPMLWTADDLEWTSGGATIPAIAVWTFATREVRYWDKEHGDREHVERFD